MLEDLLNPCICICTREGQRQGQTNETKRLLVIKLLRTFTTFEAVRIWSRVWVRERFQSSSQQQNSGGFGIQYLVHASQPECKLDGLALALKTCIVPQLVGLLGDALSAEIYVANP